MHWHMGYMIGWRETTPGNASDLAEFQEALEQVLLPPLNSEEILCNPDAPSHVWYEIHSLRSSETTATTAALAEQDVEAGDSGKNLKELQGVVS